MESMALRELLLILAKGDEQKDDTCCDESHLPKI